MGVGEHHSELVANADSLNHVADGGLDGVEKGVTLLFLQPHPEVELALILPDLDGNVLEGLLEGAVLALHLDGPALDGHSDIFGHCQLLLSDNVLHCDQKYYIKFNK